MKKTILLTLALLLCSGCAIETVSTIKDDGKIVRCDASRLSLFLDIKSADVTACGAKRNETGSSVNSALAQELFKILLTGP